MKMYGSTMQCNNKTLDYVKYSTFPPLAITHAIDANGGLKTRDWKMRDGQKCRVGKRGTEKRGTKLQDWKTR